MTEKCASKNLFLSLKEIQEMYKLTRGLRVEKKETEA